MVSVNEKSISGANISNFGYLSLIKQTDKVPLGEYVSIIQHPNGGYKSIVLRENKITDIFDNFIHYTADTFPGSSGSVVCNDNWDVIALHHSSVPDPEHPGEYIANEGIRISSILKYIKDNSSMLNNVQQNLIKDLSHNITENSMLNFDVAEDFSLERFESLTGHNPKFLGERHEIPHPKLRADLESDVAKTINGEKFLNYTHFSIVMSKSRRLAFYTVVDIDGNQLKDERRKGWRYDPRIDRKFQCGEELYGNPPNDLDKGHLVRRRDPVWGNDSYKANEDTFHFTNCSPQHRTFNQSENLWLGLEDYLLNNLRNNSHKAIIFTGPVFRDNDVIYRGIKIPEEFWKVAVVVKDDGEISATAYIVSQKELISDLEKDVPGQFRTFQVKISIVEALTGLNFFELRNHNPLNRAESTTFGRFIENFEEIQL